MVPGTVPLIEQDEKYSDGRTPLSAYAIPGTEMVYVLRPDRMDLIDGNLAVVRDGLVEYQAVEELLVADPLGEYGRELHTERFVRFGHSYALLRPDFPSGATELGGVPPTALVLFRGCRPRALRNLLARLLYQVLLPTTSLRRVRY
eukprot:969531-Rhodomonas_salina.1